MAKRKSRPQTAIAGSENCSWYVNPRVEGSIPSAFISLYVSDGQSNGFLNHGLQVRALLEVFMTNDKYSFYYVDWYDSAWYIFSRDFVNGHELEQIGNERDSLCSGGFDNKKEALDYASVLNDMD